MGCDVPSHEPMPSTAMMDPMKCLKQAGPRIPRTGRHGWILMLLMPSLVRSDHDTASRLWQTNRHVGKGRDGIAWKGMEWEGIQRDGLEGRGRTEPEGRTHVDHM